MTETQECIGRDELDDREQEEGNEAWERRAKGQAKAEQSKVKQEAAKVGQLIT